MRRRQIIHARERLGIPPEKMAEWNKNHTPVVEQKGNACPKCGRRLTRGFKRHVECCKK